MKRFSQYIRESRNVSDTTLKKMLVNLKCLGKFGRSVRGFSLKDRESAIDRLIENGWIDERMRITPEGDEIVRANLNLCQEERSGSRPEGTLARCSTNIGPDDLDDLNALLKKLELDDIITVSYGGGAVFLTVPDKNASDFDYAKAYLETVKHEAPKSWGLGKIENLM